MSFFSKTKTKWRHWIRDDNKTSGAYRQLNQLIGEPEMKRYMYEMYASLCSNKAAADYMLSEKGDTKKNKTIVFPADLKLDQFNQFLVHDRTEYARLSVHFAGLKGRDLFQDCRGNLVLPTTYGYNAGPAHQDPLINEAAHWMSAGNPSFIASNTQALRAVTGGGGSRPEIITSLTKLQSAHAGISSDAEKGYRFTGMMGQKPPHTSTGLGKLLLHQLVQPTNGRNAWPALGHDDWQDLATYFYICIVGAQGFKDANGRIGKLVYSALMIDGANRFEAPDDTWVRRQSGMQA